jgi:hypothetical protein
VILHPAIIALLTGSLLVGLMIAYAAFWGYKIIDGWDLQSGSERQLALEKKTYLVSTLMTYAFSFHVLSFFLFVFTADDLHRLFVGAMCAAGTLNVNENGYPAMVLKVLNCLLAGVLPAAAPKCIKIAGIKMHGFFGVTGRTSGVMVHAAGGFWQAHFIEAGCLSCGSFCLR